MLQLSIKDVFVGFLKVLCAALFCVTKAGA